MADVGGTNARFALAEPGGEPWAEQKLAVADYPGLVEAARAYLGERRVSDAVIAVATPVASDRIAFTNSPWTFSIRAARTALGLERLAVINDFTAQALAVPRLSADERVQLGDGQPEAHQQMAVIGPGTGLGVAGLIHFGTQWYPVASEGGHVSLAPHDEREAAVLARLHQRFGHVSCERVLSGPGLVNLATVLAEIDGEALDVAGPQDVARQAEAGDCRFCVAAFAHFSSLLGASAGDLALMFCARGGVYVGGGLVKRIGALFDVERFRASFVAKGRLGRYLEPIPTYLVVRKDPGLLGAAAYPLDA